jgi:hypothetical protein
VSKHIIHTLQSKARPAPASAVHSGMNWAFALIVSVLSVFTLTPEGRPATHSAANSATPLASSVPGVANQAFSSQKAGSTRTHTSDTGPLLSSRATTTVAGLLSGLLDNNPEGTDTDYGLNTALPDMAAAESTSVQEARFHFLVTSIHEASYTPRSPPYLA